MISNNFNYMAEQVVSNTSLDGTEFQLDQEISLARRGKKNEFPLRFTFKLI